jgi:hypothetical protein
MRNLSTGTRSQNTLRELHWSYYDTLVMATATLQTRLFTQGMSGSAKQLWQTNMKLNGQIPSGERLTVTDLKVLYSTHADVASTVYANIVQMLTRTTLEVRIAGSDSILTMTLNEVMGLSMLTTTTLVATYGAQPIWNPCFTGILKLKRPIVLAESESIEVLVTHHVAPNAALDGDWLKVALSGILERKA